MPNSLFNRTQPLYHIPDYSRIMIPVLTFCPATGSAHLSIRSSFFFFSHPNAVQRALLESFDDQLLKGWIWKDGGCGWETWREIISSWWVPFNSKIGVFGEFKWIMFNLGVGNKSEKPHDFSMFHFFFFFCEHCKDCKPITTSPACRMERSQNPLYSSNISIWPIESAWKGAAKLGKWLRELSIYRFQADDQIHCPVASRHAMQCLTKRLPKPVRSVAKQCCPPRKSLRCCF